MQKFYLVIAVCILAIGIHAQTSSTASVAGTSSLEFDAPRSSIEKVGKAPLTKNSKIEIPAEKARPVTVPKIDPVGMTIDGKPDEEVWKTAAIFQRFLSNQPGRQHRTFEANRSPDDVRREKSLRRFQMLGR
jgi:hypothetical protein